MKITKYRTGRRTYLYLLIKYCWWIVALGIAFAYLAFQIYFGSLNAFVTQFLASNPSWYVDTGMVTQWSLLISIAFFVVAYLGVSVEYRKYSFHVDDHAFHLRRGLFRVQEITIPYAQISNVHIEQPYHWRLLGLAQLDITISSSNDSFHSKKKRDFLIPCIDKPIARALSRFLIEEASGYDDDDDDEEYDDEDDGEDIEIDSGTVAARNGR
jgi:uncharacterized membrane protein YdbT with pleckstrin-like domain